MTIVCSGHISPTLDRYKCAFILKFVLGLRRLRVASWLGDRRSPHGRETLAEESATVPRGSRRRIDPCSRGKTESSFCNLLVRSCHDGGAMNDQLNLLDMVSHIFPRTFFFMSVVPAIWLIF